MHISIKWPDINALLNEAETLGDIVQSIGKNSPTQNSSSSTTIENPITSAQASRDNVQNTKNLNEES